MDRAQECVHVHPMEGLPEAESVEPFAVELREHPFSAHEIVPHDAAVVLANCAPVPRGRSAFHLLASFGHHARTAPPIVAMGFNHSLEEVRLALHQEAKSSHTVQALPKEDPAPNPCPVVILEEEKQIVAEIEVGLARALLLQRSAPQVVHVTG